jgi:hypothetical protein
VILGDPSQNPWASDVMHVLVSVNPEDIGIDSDRNELQRYQEKFMDMAREATQ